ncbi:hypothetical protein [Aquimarina sp. 2201CG5-10]|uniref:hypothetical protein n=1 Tax=Aquimarina callyspongiae TaxID=3098150 RepID=UPI002AB4AB38|nr:hypothetical protein [Aquimarina sp. 2201CG5-10]MDY8138531.1 hypothetical protein [Aquimarina sp. 2201CG5-10]
MKTTTNVIIILLLFQMTNAQNSDTQKQIKNLVDTGRDHIIQIALDEIQPKDRAKLTQEDFHFIKVMVSDKRIMVYFGYNVIYVPKNISVYTDITVELPSRTISMSNAGSGSKSSFFVSTPENKKIIDFILNAIGTDKSILKKGNRWSLQMIIYEEDTTYTVDTSSRDPYLGGGFSKEEIHKETGEILSTLSGHYEPAPIIPGTEEEKFIEITN